jgi:type II secretory pathway predicted ATPase ExeA
MVAQQIAPCCTGVKICDLDSRMLYYDLTGSKDLTVPKYSKERWVRELQDLIAQKNKPVALFIDEAHELTHATLKALKRLLEAVQDDGGTCLLFWLDILDFETNSNIPRWRR